MNIPLATLIRAAETAARFSRGHVRYHVVVTPFGLQVSGLYVGRDVVENHASITYAQLAKITAFVELETLFVRLDSGLKRAAQYAKNPSMTTRLDECVYQHGCVQADLCARLNKCAWKAPEKEEEKPCPYLEACRRGRECACAALQWGN